MGRPREIYLVPTRFEVTSGRETRVFSSRQSAAEWLGSRRSGKTIRETYFTCRGWELEHDHVPREGEPDDPDEWTGIRIYEVPFLLKGSNPEELLDRAEARRRRSYLGRQSHLVNEPQLMASLPPTARAYARKVIAEYDDKVVENWQVSEARKLKKAEEEEERRREAAIPTLRQMHEKDIERRIAFGRVKANTAEVYRYEFSAMSVPFDYNGTTIALSELQVHKMTADILKEWFESYMDRSTRHKRKPTKKTLINVLLRLKAVRDAVRREDGLRRYVGLFNMIDVVIEDVQQSAGDDASWRRRRRFDAKEITKLIDCAKSDLERAALAMLFAGCRAPSEAVAAAWDHLHEDKGGNLWWFVQASTVELKGGKLLTEGRTKTGEIDYRQLSICRKHRKWLDKLRRGSPFVLGEGDRQMTPSEFTKLLNALLDRSGIETSRLSTYSFRHTVADEVEDRFGVRARDLVLHGQRGSKTGDKHYSHADKNRRMAELTFDGKPYSEYMPWA